MDDGQDFWNWSWDELVSFDLPAVFDFVYGQTGQEINYVGHSLVRTILIFQIHFIFDKSLDKFEPVNYA